MKHFDDILKPENEPRQDTGRRRWFGLSRKSNNTSNPQNVFDGDSTTLDEHEEVFLQYSNRAKDVSSYGTHAPPPLREKIPTKKMATEIVTGLGHVPAHDVKEAVNTKPQRHRSSRAQLFSARGSVRKLNDPINEEGGRYDRHVTGEGKC